MKRVSVSLLELTDNEVIAQLPYDKQVICFNSVTGNICVERVNENTVSFFYGAGAYKFFVLEEVSTNEEKQKAREG